MSLIDEALRRVKEPLLPGTASPSSGSTTTPTPSPKIETAHSWTTTPAATMPHRGGPSHAPSTRIVTAMAIAVLMFTVVLVLGGISWLRGTMQPSQPIPAADGHAVSRSPTEAALIAPPGLTAQAPSELVLSGVVEGLGEPYAVINGAVVGVGEDIAGLELTGIREGTVTLKRSNGQELTLQVTR